MERKVRRLELEQKSIWTERIIRNTGHAHPQIRTIEKDETHIAANEQR